MEHRSRRQSGSSGTVKSRADLQPADDPQAAQYRAAAQVSLNFNCTPSGGDVVVLTGEAWIDTEAPPAPRCRHTSRSTCRVSSDIGMTPGRVRGSHTRLRYASGLPPTRPLIASLLQRTALSSEPSNDPINSEARISAVTPTATNTNVIDACRSAAIRSRRSAAVGSRRR